ERTGRARGSNRPAERVREGDGDGAACERSDRNELSGSVLVAVGDRERRTEPRAGRDAEEIRVGERIPEDALVGRSGEREHAAHATARAKSTMRGPHREAMLSSIAITRWCRTAESPLQPGRAPTVDAFWPQQMESARTITSGFAATMYSAESCG